MIVMWVTVSILGKANTQADPKVNPSRGSAPQSEQCIPGQAHSMALLGEHQHLKPEATPEGLSSLGTAAWPHRCSGPHLAPSGSLPMTLKKWRHKRLFKKQLRHGPGSFPAMLMPDSNMINLDPWRG